jgi:phage baseplate assembly protein W
MRRDYGSLLPRLIDQPFNAATRIRLFAAIATALMRWEPRLQITRVTVELGAAPGAVVVTLEGTRTDTPTATSGRFTVPLPLP